MSGKDAVAGRRSDVPVTRPMQLAQALPGGRVSLREMPLVHTCCCEYLEHIRAALAIRPQTAEVARMLKAIHAPEDRRAAGAKAREVVERLKSLKLKAAAELVEQKVGETLTYYAYPSTHWRQIRTNNPLERIIREIRRRTRVVGAFPDGHSAPMLVAARLRHIASIRGVSGAAW